MNQFPPMSQFFGPMGEPMLAMTSPSIGQIAAALAAAQAEFGTVGKDKRNTFFNSNYADLASVLEAVRAPLAAHKLAVIQVAMPTDGSTVRLRTVLAHESGEWIAGELVMHPAAQVVDKKSGEKAITPQAIGSALTYARRYALCAIVGIAAGDEDDDGNAASRPAGPAGEKKPVRNYSEPGGAAPSSPATGDGLPATSAAPAAVDQAMAEMEKSLAPGSKLAGLLEAIRAFGIPPEKQAAWCKYFGASGLEKLTDEQIDAVLAKIRETYGPF